MIHDPHSHYKIPSHVSLIELSHLEKPMHKKFLRIQCPEESNFLKSHNVRASVGDGCRDRECRIVGVINGWHIMLSKKLIQNVTLKLEQSNKLKPL